MRGDHPPNVPACTVLGWAPAGAGLHKLYAHRLTTLPYLLYKGVIATIKEVTPKELKLKLLKKLLRKAGFTFEEGKKHTLVLDSNGNLVSELPRHTEIKEITAQEILKACGLKSEWFSGRGWQPLPQKIKGVRLELLYRSVSTSTGRRVCHFV